MRREGRRKGGICLVLSPNFQTFMGPKNWVQGTNSASLCILAGQYDNPIPNRFLATRDCLKIPALVSDRGDRGLFFGWTHWFRVKIVLRFSLSIGQIIGNFLQQGTRSELFKNFHLVGQYFLFTHAQTICEYYSQKENFIFRTEFFWFRVASPVYKWDVSVWCTFPI